MTVAGYARKSLSMTEARALYRRTEVFGRCVGREAVLKAERDDLRATQGRGGKENFWRVKLKRAQSQFIIFCFSENVF